MATMTPGRWINLAASVLGAIGAIVLFNGSFAYESFSPYHSNETIKAQTARNLRRQLKQRIGIGLILASFVMQGAPLSFSIERRGWTRNPPLSGCRWRGNMRRLRAY